MTIFVIIFVTIFVTIFFLRNRAPDFEVEVFQKTSTPSLGFPENLNLALNEAKVFQKTQQKFFQKTSLKFFLEFDVKR